MRIVYFDTISGVSGDMTLGAFVSAGVSLDELSAEIGKLNLRGVELEASRIQRNGITAVKLDVVLTAAQAGHRNLRDIYTIIDESSLSGRVKENAKKIFMEVAKAEAAVHNSTVEKIHFHEVGALDSIVDIVGAAICFEKVGMQAVYSSPVKLGSGGFVDTQHGKLPIPGPAAVEILRGYPTVLTDIPFELTTPTGAAIVKAMSSGVLSMERFTVGTIGYGAGTREIPQTPNLLRIMIGESMPDFEHEEMVVVETNIDDMNPEIYPFVIEQLLATGAHDAYLVPLIMKKGRPGILLSAMVTRSKLETVLGVIFSQTTTLGVRIQPIERRKLQRSSREIHTQLGNVKAKVVVYGGVERLVPEHEECKRLAIEKNIPLLEVYKILEREFSA
jgi:uncharacterized protein (TIGR00299 family) protein